MITANTPFAPALREICEETQDDDSPPDLLITTRTPWLEDDALASILPALAHAHQYLKADFPHLGKSEISLLLSDDAAIAKLNKEWRGKDGATNVLSFSQISPADLMGDALFGTDLGHPPQYILGDIILAYETCIRESEENAINFAHHIAHLFIHGLLHLLGFDHENDGDAAKMQAVEIAILAECAIPNPYIASHDKR